MWWAFLWLFLWIIYQVNYLSLFPYFTSTPTDLFLFLHLRDILSFHFVWLSILIHLCELDKIAISPFLENVKLCRSNLWVSCVSPVVLAAGWSRSSAYAIWIFSLPSWSNYRWGGQVCAVMSCWSFAPFVWYKNGLKQYVQEHTVAILQVDQSSWIELSLHYCGSGRHRQSYSLALLTLESSCSSQRTSVTHYPYLYSLSLACCTVSCLGYKQPLCWLWMLASFGQASWSLLGPYGTWGTGLPGQSGSGPEGQVSVVMPCWSCLCHLLKAEMGSW